MSRRYHHICIAFIAAFTGHGCADANRVDLMTVLAHGNCQTTHTGVRLIDYAAVAALRGAHLVELSDSSDASANVLHLIEIVPGEYPTAGYGVRLDATQVPLQDPLLVRVTLTTPAQDAVLAQVITHPCLVVGIDDPAVEHVQVVDQNATVLGEIDLTAP